MAGDRDILFLAHRPPWPPTRGDSIRSWAVLNGLAARGRVHVLCFGDPEDRRLSEALASVATSHRVMSRPSTPVWPLANALWRGEPLSPAMFGSTEMAQRVASHLAAGVDATYVFSGQMAQYAPAGAILDLVDVDSAKFGQYARSARDPLRRWLWSREDRMLGIWERRAAERALAVLFVSDAEAALWRERGGGGAVTVVPNGIDTDRFDPARERPRPASLGSGPSILFTGQMDYPPNVEAVRCFAGETMPLLADGTVRFVIAGRSPTAAVRALASDSVVVTGEVEDMRDWLAHADVVVAPLRTARGVQNKVLEALAMARPVVASSPAATGLDLRPGTDLLVADSAEEQASAIRSLLSDVEARERLGAAGRQRVMERYGWESALAPLDDLLSRDIRQAA